jgi:hypothetical protein
MEITSLKRVILIFAILFAVICSILFIFKNEAISFYWRIKCPSPVTWGNFKIHLAKDMIYKFDSEKIVLTYWNKKIMSHMSISNFSSKPNILLDALERQGHMIVNSGYGRLNGHLSFEVKHKIAGGSTIHNSILIIPFQVLIHFEGVQEEYPLFESVVNNLEIINHS